MFCETTKSTFGDIFILFLNICRDIAFNKAVAIGKVVLYENSIKTIADTSTLLNLPAAVY